MGVNVWSAVWHYSLRVPQQKTTAQKEQKEQKEKEKKRTEAIKHKSIILFGFFNPSSTLIVSIGRAPIIFVQITIATRMFYLCTRIFV